MSADTDLDRLSRSLAGHSAACPTTKFAIVRSRVPPGLVLRVQGVLDTAGAKTFESAAMECLTAAKEYGSLILDLGGLTYASSSGIGAITTILIESQRHRTSFMLCHVPDNVSAVFDVLGFSAFFERLAGYEVAI